MKRPDKKPRWLIAWQENYTGIYTVHPLQKERKKETKKNKRKGPYTVQLNLKGTWESLYIVQLKHKGIRNMEVENNKETTIKSILI